MRLCCGSAGSFTTLSASGIRPDVYVGLGRSRSLVSSCQARSRASCRADEQDARERA